MMLPKVITRGQLDDFILIFDKIFEISEVVRKNALLLGGYKKPANFFHLVIYDKKDGKKTETTIIFFDLTLEKDSIEHDHYVKLEKKILEIYFNVKHEKEVFVVDVTNLEKNSKEIIFHLLKCCINKEIPELIFKNTVDKVDPKELLFLEIAKKIIMEHFAIQ